jgi:carbon-monoxide dehydrogenase medium subunit
LAEPTVLVDLNRIGDLPPLSTGTSLGVGALVRQRQIETDPAVEALVPLLPEAARHIAHPQIRNRGTVVGSLAHNDPAAELPAVALVLDARFELVSSGASRELPAVEFVGSVFSTAAREDEVLIRVSFPAATPETGEALVEMARRPGDFALAGVACHVRRVDGVVGALRLATFGVGGGAREYPDVTGPVQDVPATPLLWKEIAEALAAGVDPHSDAQVSATFRRHLVRTLAEEAMATAWVRSGGEDAG